jgi:hypothetical protein
MKAKMGNRAFISRTGLARPEQAPGLRTAMLTKMGCIAPRHTQPFCVCQGRSSGGPLDNGRSTGCALKTALNLDIFIDPWHPVDRWNELGGANRTDRPLLRCPASWTTDGVA